MIENNTCVVARAKVMPHPNADRLKLITLLHVFPKLKG
jgi:hypothetical protein